MKSSLWIRCSLVAFSVGLLSLAGCPGPIEKAEDGGHDKGQVSSKTDADKTGTKAEASAKVDEPESRTSTAKAEDVEAAKTLLDGLGSNASYKIVPDGVMTEIIIKDGSTLTAADIALFGRLADLEALQILNYRDLDDSMTAELATLQNLKTLALTNSVISDATVELIVASFPDLTYLDLSSNTNLTNKVLKVIAQLSKLERLSLVQNGFSDLGTLALKKLTTLKVLDLRGNMSAGNTTMGVVGALPALAALKHRSSTVTDTGMERLAKSKTLKALLMQDFGVSSQSGQHIAALPNLRELEIFRCQNFGSEGVVALKGLKLTRLQLRDLPMVDDQAMVVFEDLPALQRLYLHENDSISDEGLKSLANLQALEVLDIWAVSQMGDATIDVIATLPNLKELSIRTTGVTDASIDKILAMPKLQSLTFKDNGSVSDEAVKKLSSKKWAKLDIGQ